MPYGLERKDPEQCHPKGAVQESHFDRMETICRMNYYRILSLNIPLKLRRDQKASR